MSEKGSQDMTEALEARMPIALGDGPNVPDEIMIMPAGTHNAWLGKGGKVVNVTVLVNQYTALTLQRALEAHLAASAHRPYFDFDHEKNAAAGWPSQFLWRDTPKAGVYAKVEWSKPGAEAIRGKAYRTFSPAFWVDDERKKPALVEDAPLVMGGLVNAPAFKEILPLWAKDQRAATDKPNHMDPKEEVAALQAKITKLENENTELKGKATSSKEATEHQAALTARDTEIASLKQAKEALEGKETERRKADAKSAVEAAVARGALPPKDTALQAKWQGIIEGNPENAELLAKLPGRDFRPVTQPKAEHERAQITREASGTVLKAYLEAKEGRDRGEFYAREIRPRLSEGDDMPLHAADVTDENLGTLSGSLVTQRALDLFRLEFDGVLSRVATDFSAERAQFGQSIISRVVVVPAVETYATDTGWTQQTAAQTVDVPIVINQHKGVPLIFNTNTLAQTVRRLFDEQAPAASYALAKNVVDALYAVITAANFADPAPTVVAEVDFGRATFVKTGGVFNKGGVPQTNRFALLSTDYHTKLEQDPTLVQLAVYQKQEMITTGMLPPIKKFQPIEAPNLPATGNLAAFFGHKSSLVIAARTPNDYTAVLPGSGNGRVTIVSDENGFSVMLVEYVNHQMGTANWRIALMYGVGKGNAKGGRIIKSA